MFSLANSGFPENNIVNQKRIISKNPLDIASEYPNVGGY
jgi:hypothetical protein